VSAYKFEIGQKYLIRTVTMILVGECVADYADAVGLKRASWIADTGRYQQAVATGVFSEVELYPADKEVFVFKGGIIDGFSADFELPSSQR
jgi:hypothetical protein